MLCFTAFVNKHTATNIRGLLAVTIKLNAAGFLTYSNFPKQHSVTADQCLITSTINKPVQYSFIVIRFFFSSNALYKRLVWVLSCWVWLGPFYFKVIGMISFSVYFEVVG